MANMYRDYLGDAVYASGIAMDGRLACVKVEIDCEEGEGL